MTLGSVKNLRTMIVLLASAASLMACGQNSANSDGTALGIIGGQNVNPTDALARVTVALYDVDQHALCTATIISAKFLVTAAHCVNPKSPASLRVVYGTDLNNKATIVAVGKVTGAMQSPAWGASQNQPKNTGDIALVRLASAPPAGYGPAQILNQPNVLQAGQKVLLAGYGISTGHPDPKSTNDNGAGVLRSVVTTMLNPAYSQTEVMLDESQGRGACHGDSGGPAYASVGGKAMLFGVTSRGTDQFCSKGVIYTNILAYSAWLSKAAQALEAASTAAPGFFPRMLADLHL